MDTGKIKILVVDDSKTMVTLIKSSLENEGFHVLSAVNGKDALSIIQNITPDLIISDINMPEMDGMEFRNIINHQQKLSLIPFIFLTAKNLVKDKILGLESGADYYLTKPFEPGELVAIVKSRLSKFHKVDDLIKIDKLTGLLNRRAIDEILNDEFQRISKAKSFLSVALFDIDNFKKINDTHGHPAGDLILRSVASEIHKGIKDFYFAGRYGGEEFLVIMPDTLKELACRVADNIRLSISRLVPGEMNVRPQISGGVATAPDDGDEAAALVSAADHALYRAKESGRNRIVAYGNG